MGQKQQESMKYFSQGLKKNLRMVIIEPRSILVSILYLNVLWLKQEQSRTIWNCELLS